ncbi:gp42, conserved hypothetical protein [Burkholderia phage phiE12-2]|uniref:Uncharacterized protein n=1 Tax=Burkholderia phage phiE12-2 TaxID=2881401 RepID=A4JWY7_9CAUD|nr:gp42, conserved hypothetical protein [Burkholderia phage phiE12-2]ABO60781.1 gp42, conserved hypothetical protein [Burkholderia phage phiE12-2]
MRDDLPSQLAKEPIAHELAIGIRETEHDANRILRERPARLDGRFLTLLVDTCDAREPFVETDREARTVDIDAQIARGAQLPEHRLALDAAGLLAQALAARLHLPRLVRAAVRIPLRGDARLLRAAQIAAELSQQLTAGRRRQLREQPARPSFERLKIVRHESHSSAASSMCSTVRLPASSVPTTTLSDSFTLSPRSTALFDRMSATNVMPLRRSSRFVTRSG